MTHSGRAYQFALSAVLALTTGLSHAWTAADGAEDGGIRWLPQRQTVGCRNSHQREADMTVSAVPKNSMFILTASGILPACGPDRLGNSENPFTAS
jgi:hypothetical protein